VLTRVMGWKADKVAGSTDVGVTWNRLHSSDSQTECEEVEL
jgi:hypothetical protein